jgi:alpha-tubulin suppressor-like RCC1 family protein
MRSLLHITVAGLALLWAATAQGAPTVVQASAGMYHSLFVESDGSLWAMGANGNGQLGDGTTTERHVPVMIEPSNVVAVAAGLNFSLFLTSDGNLWAMGANGNGQLGDGTTTEQHRPEQIVFTGGVTAISAGGAHSLFLKTNVLWGMGLNSDGQLGTGNSTDIHGASQLLTNAVYGIAAGTSHSIFLTTDGSVWTMGKNDLGQLGDGDTSQSSRYSPVEVLTNHSVFAGGTAVYAGYLHSMYVYVQPVLNYSLWGMGDNLDGDMGDGSNDTRYSPTQIPGSGVTAAAAGGGFTLIVESGGSLWATGANIDGQLGTGQSGQFAVEYSPMEIEPSGVTAVSAGYAHSVFIKSDGSLWGMGYNFNGQLGVATNGINVPVPVRIYPPLQLLITQTSVSGTNLVVQGNNDFNIGQVFVLASTNVALPLNQWTGIWTNPVLTGPFSFTVTNAVRPDLPQRFFRLELVGD